MNISKSRAPFAWVVLACLALGNAASAQTAPIKDEAGFFSESAVKQASDISQRLKLLYRKDFRAETFKAIPADKATRYNQMDLAGKDRFMKDWARTRAKVVHIEGIYILVCKNPAKLEVLEDDTSTKVFPAADRNKLRDLLIANFKAKDFDKGLLDAAAFVYDRLEERLSPGHTVAIANMVKDGAGFFARAAVEKANEELKDFKLKYKRDLVIETFTTVPRDRRKQVDAASGEEKNRLFAAWLKQRSEAAKMDGIHVLICREPPQIQVGVSEDVARKDFPAGDRDRLAKLLTEGFKEKKYDQTLAEAVHFVYDTVDLHVTAPLAAPVAGTVRDYARMFNTPDVEKAAAAIKEIKDKRGFDLTIETLQRVPPGKLRAVLAMAPKARNEFFRNLTSTRAKEAGAHGVWVLICKQPRHIDTGVAGEALKKGQFTAADRTALEKLLTADFNDKKPNQALLAAVDFVSETLTALVKDEAGLFKPETITAARRHVKEIKKRDKLDVLIETMPGIPADKKEAYEKLKAADAASLDPFFRELAAERARAVGVSGIHVLIVKEPPRVEVGVDAAAQKQFGPADRNRLRDRLVAQLKENHADKGLLDTLAFIADTLPAMAIRDEAGLFSQAALEKGNEAIRDIRRRSHKDVLVETHKEIPPEKAKGVDLNNSSARGQVLAAWAKERQKAAGLDGISILICNSPMSLQVATGPETGKKWFTEPDRHKLAEVLLARFREKNFDGGLEDGLAFIDQTVQRNVSASKDSDTAGKAKTETPVAKTDKTNGGTAAAKPDIQFDPMWIVWGLLGLLGLWIFIGILRGLFGRRAPPPQPVYPAPQPQYGNAPPPAYGNAPPPAYGGRPPAYGGQPPAYGSTPPVVRPAPQYAPPPAAPQGGGGGGFLSGMLGGMFGAVAGSWLYDRFSGHSGGPNYPQQPPHHTGGGQTAGGGADGGYVSSGGDYGDQPASQGGYASSGGDFGDQPAEQTGYASSGGDFGAQAPEQAGYASSGGDFGSPAPDQGGYASSGGDFDQQQPPANEYASSGGDYAEEPTQPTDADASSGGDWGGGEEQVADSGGDSSGGDFGDSSGADSGGGGGDDTSGGSF